LENYPKLESWYYRPWLGHCIIFIWEKRHSLTEVFSSLLGVLLIAFVLFRSWFVISFDAVLTFIAALGLAMLV